MARSQAVLKAIEDHQRLVDEGVPGDLVDHIMMCSFLNLPRPELMSPEKGSAYIEQYGETAYEEELLRILREQKDALFYGG